MDTSIQTNAEDAHAGLEELLRHNVTPGHPMEGALPVQAMERLQEAMAALAEVGDLDRAVRGPRVLVKIGYGGLMLLGDEVSMNDALRAFSGAVIVEDSYGTLRAKRERVELMTVARGHKSIGEVEKEEAAERGRLTEAIAVDARAELEATDEYALAFAIGEEAARMGVDLGHCPYKGDEVPGLAHGWLIGYQRARKETMAQVSKIVDDVVARAGGQALADYLLANGYYFCQGVEAGRAGQCPDDCPYSYPDPRATSWWNGMESVTVKANPSRGEDIEKPIAEQAPDPRPLMPAGQSISLTTTGGEIIPLTRNEETPPRVITRAYLQGRAAFDASVGRNTNPWCGVSMPNESREWRAGYDDAEQGIPVPDGQIPLFEPTIEEPARHLPFSGMEEGADIHRLDPTPVTGRQLFAEAVAHPDGFGGTDFPDPATVINPAPVVAGDDEKEDPEGGY